MTEIIQMLDSDQPATCPKCGTRTEFEELTERKQRHTCPRCRYTFIGEVELEPMSVGQAIMEMVEYMDNMVHAIDGIDIETAEYLEKKRLALNTAIAYVESNNQLFEAYMEGAELP